MLKVVIAISLAALFMLTALAVSPSHRAVYIDKIVVAHSATYPPFSYLDENKEPKGYLIDLWKAFGAANGIRVEFRLVPWEKSLDLVKKGKADVHGGLFYSPERDTFLDFGADIDNLPTCLFRRTNVDEELKPGTLVGTIKGGYASKFMVQSYPNNPQIHFESQPAMLKAAERGEIQFFVADQPTSIYYQRKRGVSSLFTQTKELYSNPLRPAVRQGNSELLFIIQEGWEKTGKDRQDFIRKKWFIQEQDMFPPWLYSTLVLLAMLLVAAFIFRCALNRKNT